MTMQIGMRYRNTYKYKSISEQNIEWATDRIQRIARMRIWVEVRTGIQIQSTEESRMEMDMGIKK